ncbi:MAG TPA: sigma-70 family RNA polymerase sigma factor [Ktedonobacterales bacterium]|jgi:RNA polymerase sigma-70 factor (ECF subfamily)
MINRIAVGPAGRWRIWQPLAECLRGQTWWRLGALARHDAGALPGRATDLRGEREGRLEGDAAPGPRAALDTLYQQHARAVLGYLYSRLPALADAEDALGDVFVAALQACAAGAAPDLPWLLLVARRRAADFYRARARGDHAPLPDDDETARSIMADSGAQPEAQSLRAEQRRELRALVAALPGEQREALALRFADGLRAPQIATVLGKSDDAVRALLSRAVRRLRQQWNQEETR